MPSDFFGELAVQVERLSRQILRSVKSALNAFTSIAWRTYTSIEWTVVSTISGILILTWSARLLGLLILAGAALIYLRWWLLGTIYFMALAVIFWYAYSAKKDQDDASASAVKQDRESLEKVIRWVVRAILLATTIATTAAMLYWNQATVIDLIKGARDESLSVQHTASLPQTVEAHRQPSNSASTSQAGSTSVPKRSATATDSLPRPVIQPAAPAVSTTQPKNRCGGAIFCDSFDGPTISGSWSFGGSNVVIGNGALSVTTTKTDAGGHATISFPLPATGLTIRRKAKLQHGNNHAMPSFSLAYRDKRGNEKRIFSIFYGNMIYRDATYGPVVGTFLAPDSVNPHFLSGKASAVEGPAVLWNEWYREKIVFNRSSGLVSYYRDGANQISTIVETPPQGTTVYLRLDAWGWWTGHSHLMDDLIVAAL